MALSHIMCNDDYTAEFCEFLAQAVAAWCSVVHCVAVCCSVLQRVALCCSVLQHVAACSVCCSMLQCAAVCHLSAEKWHMAYTPIDDNTADF